MTSDDVFNWLRIDLNSAVAFHTDQAQKMRDPANVAFEKGRASLAETMLERLEKCKAGLPPVHYEAGDD